jgi:hypothetical protein
MAAAPSPWTARAATSTHSAGARPHAADATVNRAIPPSSSRRRPSTSPSRPALTISVVLARRYARTTHWTSWKEAPNTWASVGNATLVMLVPSEDNSTERDRVTTTHPTGCR